MQGCVNILAGLAKARHPAAKAANQASASHEVSRKRSCDTGRPEHMRTSGGENTSLHKGASILVSLRNGPSKKQRSLGELRALPLRPIPTYKRHSEVARAPSSARHGRLKSIAGLSPRRSLSTTRPLALRAGHISSARSRLT